MIAPVICTADFWTGFCHVSPTLTASPPTWLTVITHSLSQIFLSRFFINLQEASEPNTGDDSAMPSSIIDRVVGNLGESLVFRDEDLGDEVDTEHHDDESHLVTVEGHTSDVVEGSRLEVGDSDESVC